MIAGTEKPGVAKTTAKKTLGALAEYRSPDELLGAARRMKEAGYTKIEAFSPFPVHGMDEAIGIQPSILPWLVLIAGLIGGVSALAFQWWTNTIDYAYIVSGKPMFSLPANIPITFEVIILFAASAAFFGMLALNGLPKLANPLLRNDRFRRVTNDGFFLFVDSDDSKFSQSTRSDLRDITAAASVENIKSNKEAESANIPRWILLTGVVVGSFALLPPVMIAKARTTKSDKPRFHNFFNMDFQPKFKSQTESPLFADRRAMRPRVEGTIPRNSLIEDERFLYGIEPRGVTSLEDAESSSDSRISSTETKRVAVVTKALTEPNFVREIPIAVTEQLVRDGRTQFNIHCSVCHGKAGYGNGLASQRALELEQGTWVPPTSIHSPHLVEQPDGQLFNSITNGVRKMPAYGHQITPRDRWAIVAYVRALQRSQNAKLDDVPEDYRPTLREFN